MRTKIILAATLALPLLVIGCNRQEQSPTAAGPSQEKQAANTPSPADKMLESAPPAAGVPPSSTSPSAPSSSSPSTSEPSSSQSAGSPPEEPKKGY